MKYFYIADSINKGKLSMITNHNKEIMTACQNLKVRDIILCDDEDRKLLAEIIKWNDRTMEW